MPQLSRIEKLAKLEARVRQAMLGQEPQSRRELTELHTKISQTLKEEMEILKVNV